MKVIFHADDMGATPAVSRRILEAWRAGIIDGFSIVANGDGLDVVSRELSEEAGREARIGVHLNVSDGRSVLPRDEVGGLVDRDGYFRYGFSAIFLKLLACSPSKRRRLLDQIEREWRGQIHRAREVCGGRRIRALDGHIHVHMIPFLFPVAAGLAVEEDIPEIRIPREIWPHSLGFGRIFSPRSLVNCLKWIVLRLLSSRARDLRGRYGIGGPEAFIGVLNAGRMTRQATRESLERLKRLGVESCEVLFHVGGAPVEEVSSWNPNLPTFRFLVSDGRRKEYEELSRLRAEMDGGEPGAGRRMEGAER